MASIYDKSSLVLIPSGTKTGKVFSQKPVSGDGDFTFTRASAATRVNADGNIEKETMNLMPYSNDFSQWSPKSGTFAQGVSDPFGGNDAWSLTATNVDPYLYRNPLVTGLVTLSVWAKGVGSSIGKNFLLVSNGSSPSTSTHTLTSEWVRYESYFNATSTNIIGFEIPNPAVVGDVVHIYGAQLEYGLVARDYQETTTAAVYGGITDNTPRLDYTDSSCPALLLEPQRTNVVINSEYIAGYSSSNTTITQNYGISPEGVQNSTRIQFAGTGYIAFSVASYTNETTSMYVKGTAGQILRFGKGGNVAQGALYTFTGDWQRITYSGGTGSTFIISNFSGANANDFEVYGLQHEEGSYATSYIPTYGSSVSRVAEGRNYSGLSSLIGQTEGTLFLDIDNANLSTEIFSLNRSTQNAIFLITSNTYYRVFIYCDGTNLSYTTSINITDRIRVAIAYQSNNLAVYVNGSQAYTNNTITWTPNVAMDLLNFNNGGYASSKGAARYNQVLLFKERLSNADLATLTTI